MKSASIQQTLSIKDLFSKRSFFSRWSMSHHPLKPKVEEAIHMAPESYSIDTLGFWHCLISRQLICSYSFYAGVDQTSPTPSYQGLNKGPEAIITK
jgi:hypothetical protein